MVQLLGAILAWRFITSFSLTVQTANGQDDECSFSAEAVGYEGVMSESMNRTTFICEGSGEYVTEVRMAAVAWIDGLQVLCSSGEESPWFGDPEGGNVTRAQARGGWTSIIVTTIDWYGTEYPSLPSVFVYDPDGRENGEWVGPFGSVDPSGDYGDESTSDCGSASWVNGVTILDNEDYVLSVQLECRSATNSTCPVPEGLLVHVSTLAPTTAPIPETPYPTTTPILETLSTETPTGFRESCTENSCNAGYCCSATGECGGISDYCRKGLCCPSGDDAGCEVGTTQCLIGSEEPVAWYESPTFIGVSTAAGIVTAIGGGGYTLYRHITRGAFRFCARTPTT